MRLKETDIHGLTNSASARSLKCWVNIGAFLLGKRPDPLSLMERVLGTDLTQASRHLGCVIYKSGLF